MKEATKSVIKTLIIHRKIGGSHMPEKYVYQRVKWLDKKATKDFEDEYKSMINQGIIMRCKKKTGKGDEWHVSLNPKYVNKLKEELEL